MAIKESSDELNPPVLAGAAVEPDAREPRSAKDYLALAIATCGVGYLPLAPGTWGSLVGIALYLLVRGLLMMLFFETATTHGFNLLQVYYLIIALELLALFVIAGLGFWAGSRTEKLSDRKDPGIVVIDEVAGQFIALMPVPFMFHAAWWPIVVAFILFRFFDIIKPYPARKMESLKGGMGIMADDLVAGVYAALGVMLTVCASWFI